MVSAVLAGRYIFLGLGLVTASTVLYTCITDGTPFRSELLTPYAFSSFTLLDFQRIRKFVFYLVYMYVYVGVRLCLC